MEKSVEEVAASVKFFKIKPIFNGKGKKEQEIRVHLAMENQKVKIEEFADDVDISTIFVNAFLKIGMTQKLGPGPAGQMERLVQQWLEKTKKK